MYRNISTYTIVCAYEYIGMPSSLIEKLGVIPVAFLKILQNVHGLHPME
jgi:hypothetical protein